MKIIIALIVLSVIIIVHEFGHFLLAKKNGIKVNEFSVGMGPRIISHQGKETRYSLKLLPLGGSCMMLGEDETSEDPRAFNRKSVWARISVIAAGPIFNFILAFVLAMFIVGATGYDKPIVNNIIKGYSADTNGLQNGDLILKIGGSNATLSRDLDIYYLMNPLDGSPVDVVYERDGKEYTTTLVPEVYEKYMLGFSYTQKASNVKIQEVTEGGALAKAGLKAGDVITEIDGNAVTTPEKLSEYLEVHPLTNKAVSLTYERDGKKTEVSVTPMLASKAYTLGFGYSSMRSGKEKNPLTIIRYSYEEVRYWIKSTLGGLKMMVTGKVQKDDIAGPVGIVNLIGESYESGAEIGPYYIVLNLAFLMIFLSANLGVMNLLPLPALDGGRLVFLIIEAVRGKPVDPEKEGMVHLVGFALLMVLMVFVMFNDISNIIH